jgi:probable rRNA maturation factor
MGTKDNNFSITFKSKSKLLRKEDGLLFLKMKEKILGKKYNLSLVFCGEKMIAGLNTTYRKKNVPTDILSFSISKNEGEIFICPKRAEAKAKKFGRNRANFFAFLLIHGLTHLKGFKHSSKMESVEQRFRKIFGV